MEPTSPFDVEWLHPDLAPVLLGLIALAVVGTTVLFCCGAVAYSRRRSTRYLLISAVLGLLVARSVIGLATAFGLVPMMVHHLIEHGVDVTIAVLVLYVVYRSGAGRGDRTDGRAADEEPPSTGSDADGD